jgi:hypothetical protein
MAKSKSEPVKTEALEEVKTEEVKAEPKKQGNEAFITRTLKAINKMENSAKAERLANRLLRKKARN